MLWTKDIRAIFVAVGLVAIMGAGIGLGSTPVAAQDPIEIAPAFVVDRYRASAAQGDVRAQFRLGLLHERGLVTGEPDLTQARQWYRQAAEAGHPSAQFKTASFLAAGIGGAMDLPAAVLLYRSAAEQGVAEAQFNLAVLLQEGRGVAPDHGEAIRWFEQAAFRGIVPAMRALGLLYLAEVETSPNDAIEAWAWLTLAMENGDTLATRLRNDAEDRLTASSRDEAVRLADAYRQLLLQP